MTFLLVVGIARQQGDAQGVLQLLCPRFELAHLVAGQLGQLGVRALAQQGAGAGLVLHLAALPEQGDHVRQGGLLPGVALHLGGSASTAGSDSSSFSCS